MIARVLNLTPHPVEVTVGGESTRLDVAGPAARVTETASPLTTVDSGGVRIPIVSAVACEVVHLPTPRAGTVLIVSRAVAAACPDRLDLVVPFDEIRDARGRVVGCRALARLSRED